MLSTILLIMLEITIHIQDIVDTPNKVAINYVISSRTHGADFDIDPQTPEQVYKLSCLI